ncbi:hypothetical protein AAMO2058_000653700 [Amorphochlora amoebiformis]
MSPVNQNNTRCRRPQDIVIPPYVNVKISASDSGWGYRSGSVSGSGSGSGSGPGPSRTAVLTFEGLDNSDKEGRIPHKLGLGFEGRKKHLAYFSGSIHWTSKGPGYMDPLYSWGIRQVLQSLYLGDPDVRIQSTRRSKNDYYQHIMNSVFCLDIPGWATWTPRLQESMSVGCIPVIIGNDTDLPFQDYIEYDKFVLCVSERDAIKPGQLKRILQAINPERINSMISWMSVYRDGILYDRDELYHHLVRSLQKSLSHPR